MERLTEIRDDIVYYTGKHTKLPGMDCASTMRVAAIREVMQRLADYEATGLEPEQIKEKPTQTVVVKKLGRSIMFANMFECCHHCTAPKRQPGCHDRCPEYKAAKAEYEASKAEYDHVRGRDNGTAYAQKVDAIRKATRHRR